jgi:hypothetical protein
MFTVELEPTGESERAAKQREVIIIQINFELNE